MPDFSRVRVVLTEAECLFTAFEACYRHLYSVARGHNQDCYAKSDGKSGWDRDIEGAGAERAFAKATNMYHAPTWGGPAFDAADIGSKYHVRQTKYHNGHLIIRPDDKPGIYILVTGIMPNYEVVGWCHFEKRDEYPLSLGPTNDGELAHWIPPKVLTPFRPKRIYQSIEGEK